MFLYSQETRKHSCTGRGGIWIPADILSNKISVTCQIHLQQISSGVRVLHNVTLHHFTNLKSVSGFDCIFCIFYEWKTTVHAKSPHCLPLSLSLLSLYFVPQFVGVEGLITGIMDMLPPKSALGSLRREVVAAICCVICFLIDMSMVTEVR